MPFIQAGDLVLHYDLRGPERAPVVMFGNSLGSNLHLWDAQIDALADYRLLRFDARGHGLSDAPPVPNDGAGYTMQLLGSDALALLDALGIERVHFCGLSIGGMIGQVVAAAAPQRISSLTLSSTGNRIGPPANWQARIDTVRKGGVAALAGPVLERWFTPRLHAEAPTLVRGFHNMLVRTPPDGYIGCACALRDADLESIDRSITAPTQVLVGDGDTATPPELGEALSTAIPGAQFTVIPGGAHILNVERAAEFNAALVQFLRDHPS